MEAEHFAGPLGRLCTQILEPIRAKWGPVIVHSGFRCKALNDAVGSKDTSQHMRGEACDFHVLGRLNGEPLKEVFIWIWKQSGLKFGQLIWECGTWIHVSLPTLKQNQQVMDYDGKKYTKLA